MKIKYIVIGLITTLASAVLLIYWQLIKIETSPLLIAGNALYTLPAGTSKEALQKDLVEKQIMAPTFWWQSLFWLHPELKKFKAGTYRLYHGMTLRQLLQLLVSGKEAQFPLRFREGGRLQTWLDQLRVTPNIEHTLKEDTYRAVAGALRLDENKLEGWFWPDTYFFTAGTTDVALLKRAHAGMQRHLGRVWQTRKADLPYKNQDELLIMASIIEKETGLQDERAKVASVFVNRLRIGMRLQTDPTVIYGLHDKYTGSLRRSDLKTVTKYNTYLIEGLPPGAICAPSLVSLQAAANPVDSDYFYFVANGEGGHTFNTDYATHVKAVRTYRAKMQKKNAK